MGISYLRNGTWADVSREERLFCAHLFVRARGNVLDFVTLLSATTNLKLSPQANWDVGYEVCFYRDIMAAGLARNVDAERKFSLKRTFDLCLFSDQHIVVIEAKAYEAFTSEQATYFERDLTDIPALLGQPVEVSLIALASSKYFAAFDRFGRGSALKPFGQARLTWLQLANHYHDQLFARADALYRGDPARLVEAETRSLIYPRRRPDELKQQLRDEIAQRQRVLAEIERESEG